MRLTTRRLGIVAASAGATLALTAGASSAASGGRPAAGKDWQGTWAAAMTAAEPVGFSHNGFNNQTDRMIVHTTVGGSQVRIRLSNAFGAAGLQVGHATIALPDTSTAKKNDVAAGSIHDLTFGGQTSTTIPAGTSAYSDPVTMPVAQTSDLVVTVYFPSATGPVTWHATSGKSSFVGPGDLTHDATGASYTQLRTCCWTFLSGVDVMSAHPEKGSIVVMGDSISDGNANTLDADQTWPELLAARLLAQGAAAAPAVLNASLSGNRLNHDGTEPSDSGEFPGFVQLGQNALTRLPADVFGQLKPTTVVLEEGLDDIWMNGDSTSAVLETIDAIAAQVHARGMRILVATITPFHGLENVFAGAWTPDKEATRQAVNAALRASTAFDGVLDFDAILRDPADPSRLNAAYDSGDHFQVNDAGSQALSSSISLSTVRPPDA
jgi:lysophospholipase L1-like esterase